MMSLIENLPECSIKVSSTPFEDIVRSIIGQQLSIKAASTIQKRFIELVGFPIHPQTLVELEDRHICEIGISRSKCGYIKNVANTLIDNPSFFSAINELSDEEIIRELTKIKGIGIWTAQMFLMFSLCRLNVIPHGDIGIQNSVQRYYGLISKPSKEELENIALAWSPYRTIAC